MMTMARSSLIILGIFLLHASSCSILSTGNGGSLVVYAFSITSLASTNTRPPYWRSSPSTNDAQQEHCHSVAGFPLVRKRYGTASSSSLSRSNSHPLLLGGVQLLMVKPGQSESQQRQERENEIRSKLAKLKRDGKMKDGTSESMMKEAEQFLNPQESPLRKFERRAQARKEKEDEEAATLLLLQQQQSLAATSEEKKDGSCTSSIDDDESKKDSEDPASRES